MTSVRELPRVDSQPGLSRRWSIAQVATMFSIVGGIVLRWAQLGKNSLWFDEGYTAWVVSHPVPEIVRLIGADTAPPGYYVLLRGWVNVFGSSEAGLRSLSALASSIALIVFWRAAVRILAKPPAVAVATLVFAFGYMQVGYAHECRFYALMSLLGVVDFYLVLLLCERWSVARLSATAVCWAVSLYLNNVMGIYLACLGIAWLFLPGERPIGKRFVDACVVSVFTAAAFAPWLPIVLRQSKSLKGNFWADVPDGWMLIRTTVVFAGVNDRTFDKIDHRGFYWSGRSMDWLQEHWRYAIAILTVLIAWVVVTISRTGRWRSPVALLLLAVGPIAIVFVYSQIGQSIFMDRAFMGSSFALPLLVGLPWTIKRTQETEPSGSTAGSAAREGIVVAPDRRPRGGATGLRLLRGICTAALVVMMLPSLWSQRLSEHEEDWRTLCTVARPIPGHRQLTVFVANEGEMLYDYYVNQGDYAPKPDQVGAPAGYFAIDPPHTMVRVKADADLDNLRRQLDRNDFDQVVLVASHRWFADHDNQTFKLLKSRYELIDKWTPPTILAVYRFCKYR